jgi:hypothetical protein
MKTAAFKINSVTKSISKAFKVSKNIHYKLLKKHELRLNNTQKQETLCGKYEKLHKS